MTTQYIELSPDGQAGQKPKVGNHIIDWVRSPNFISRYAVCVILSVQKGTSLVKRSIRASGKTERRTGKVGSLFFCLLKGQRHLKTKHIQQVMEYAVTCFFIGFSRLRTLEFFVFRKMEMSETKNHPLCGWSQQCYTKNHLSVRIELFRLLC